MAYVCVCECVCVCVSELISLYVLFQGSLASLPTPVSWTLASRAQRMPTSTAHAAEHGSMGTHTHTDTRAYVCVCAIAILLTHRTHSLTHSDTPTHTQTQIGHVCHCPTTYTQDTHTHTHTHRTAYAPTHSISRCINAPLLVLKCVCLNELDAYACKQAKLPRDW